MSDHPSEIPAEILATGMRAWSENSAARPGSWSAEGHVTAIITATTPTIQAEALRDAATAWQQLGEPVQESPITRWLRARADQLDGQDDDGDEHARKRSALRDQIAKAVLDFHGRENPTVSDWSLAYGTADAILNRVATEWWEYQCAPVAHADEDAPETTGLSVLDDIDWTADTPPSWASSWKDLAQGCVGELAAARRTAVERERAILGALAEVEQQRDEQRTRAERAERELVSINEILARFGEAVRRGAQGVADMAEGFDGQREIAAQAEAAVEVQRERAEEAEAKAAEQPAPAAVKTADLRHLTEQNPQILRNFLRDEIRRDPAWWRRTLRAEMRRGHLTAEDFRHAGITEHTARGDS